MAIVSVVGLALSSSGALAQTSDTTSSMPDPNDDGYDGPQGAADAGPTLSGIIVGLLFVGIVALLFVGYLRYRD